MTNPTIQSVRKYLSPSVLATSNAPSLTPAQKTALISAAEHFAALENIFTEGKISMDVYGGTVLASLCEVKGNFDNAVINGWGVGTGY